MNRKENSVVSELEILLLSAFFPLVRYFCEIPQNLLRNKMSEALPLY
jgi:hypothetical protein